MREILFRGKCTTNGEWVYGSLIQSKNSASTWSEELKDDVEVDPKTVGQWTGLVDINGKRIFEGDRVKVPMYRSLGLENLLLMEGTVEWKNGAFHVTWDDKDEGRHFVGYLQDVQVIGNIYDNPEIDKGCETKEFNSLADIMIYLFENGLKKGE